MTKATKKRNDTAFLWRALGESGLIVFSVVLALLLNEHRSSRERRAQLEVAMANVTMEMENNLQTLGRWRTYHRKCLDNFLETLEAIEVGDSEIAEELETAQGIVLWKLLPRGLVQELLSRTAWGTLRDSPVAADLDFGTLTRMASVYDLQASGVEKTVEDLRRHLISRETMDPDRVAETLILVSRLLGELVSQEEFLLVRLEETLASLEG